MYFFPLRKRAGNKSKATELVCGRPVWEPRTSDYIVFPLPLNTTSQWVPPGPKQGQNSEPQPYSTLEQRGHRLTC